MWRTGGGNIRDAIESVFHWIFFLALICVLVLLMFSMVERVFPGTIDRAFDFIAKHTQDRPHLPPAESRAAAEMVDVEKEEESVPAAQYDTSGAYERDQLVGENLARLASSDGLADVLYREAAPGKKVSVHIDGMLQEGFMEQLLQVVQRHNTPVSFFISGMQAVEAPEVVKAIADAGYEVGNYTLRAQKNLQNLSSEELVEDFTVAGDVLRRILGSTPTRLKANASAYTDDLLKAANASGIANVMQSTAFLTFHSFKSAAEVQTYVDRCAYEDIITVKLAGVLDDSEYTPKEIVEQPAIDKRESASASVQPVEKLSEEERVIQMVDWLLTAIEGSTFSPESVDLREANAGSRAQVINGGNLYTAEPAVAYIFFGLGRQAELDSILDALRQLSGVGTFLDRKSVV